MVRTNRLIQNIILLLVLLASGCSDKGTDTPEWEWSDDEETETSNADKPKFLWIDAAANFPDFANDKDNILRDLTLAKEAGFTHVVVDVRPTTGDVLFQTDVVEQVEWLDTWVSSSQVKIERTATWDYLQAFIDAGHSIDLKVYAGFNTFVGGNLSSFGSAGALFRDADKQEWATQLLTSSGIESTLDQSTEEAKFYNPVNEDVQEYICSMLEDLAAYDDLDGIILDRARFDDLDSDFSDYTKEKFEDYLGYSIANFPDNVMQVGTTAGYLPSSLPTYFKQWLEFRAKVIHDFMEKARTRVKAINSNIQFGVYVGGWYSTYYDVGVNWASPDYNTSTYYSEWASSKYKNYGYADLMDIIIIGAYASPTCIYGSTEWTVQGFCSNAYKKINGDATVVGGPDVGNGDWATASDAVTGEAIIESVDAAINACDGYFLFDMIHLKQKDQWNYAKEGIDAVITEDE